MQSLWFRNRSALLLASTVTLASVGCTLSSQAESPPEVRGTWLTTTANDHLTEPKLAQTMTRLREIGLNTVYVESWKNGYTQFPSETLRKVVGVERHPDLAREGRPPRDLLHEAVREAHRNDMLCIAWFEYGFMAAYKETDNHLRRLKPEWLSQDINGEVVAPNGFVWMNPLHPEARRFLLDLVLEAIDNYDLDGIQLDDRIVWPYVTMGYDPFTRAVYANEHDGRQPPDDHTDPEWMRWRADKVNEYAQQFVDEVRARDPNLIVSLSPAPYPWCWDNYLLEWPDWARQGLWDEYIPQCYRTTYDAFDTSWLEQIGHIEEAGGDASVSRLLAGIRVVGTGPDTTWPDLKRKIERTRSTRGGGHVLWFSRGVLDLYEDELRAFYNVDQHGHAPHPHAPPNHRLP